MTYSDALAFQAGCFALSAAATAFCIYSLLKWQAREMLDRIAARLAKRAARR